MQKLQLKLKNVPTNASQVCSSTNSGLNKVERLSDQNIVLDCNNPEVNLHQQTGGLKVKVFVLSKQGTPLMPCTCTKARKLIKGGKANVITKYPFTIKLNFECENKVQDVTLGIDSGYKNIGFSAISEKQELISGVLTLDQKTSERLQERLMYRRGRRNKLWYRKSRWLNRVSTKKEGWLPPSILRRYETHLNLIKRIKKLLPISKIRIEVANFDIQKLENPTIEGVQYQKGNLYNYRNRIAYLIAREKGLCQFCKKPYKKGDGWRLHHIFGKEKDRSKDWALLHKSCHDELHQKHLEYVLRKQKSKSYKDSAFMNCIKWRFKQNLNCEITYGNITFQDRVELNLEKSHINDAFVIAKGKNQERVKSFDIVQRHRNNRVLQLNRKGFKPSIKKEKSKINPYDLFWIKNKKYVCKGLFNYGRYICYGSTKLKEYFKFSDVTKIFKFGSLVWNI